MPIKLPSHDADSADYTTAIVSSIPIRTAEGDAVPDRYLLQHHDGSTVTKSLMEMDELADSPINKTRSSPTPSLPIITRLPAWLQHDEKVTYDHNGEFHKGFIQITTDGAARFSCRRQKSSKTESWGVALPPIRTAEGDAVPDRYLLQHHDSSTATIVRD